MEAYEAGAGVLLRLSESMTDRLHLGCGRTYRVGWHNVDQSEEIPVDERVDLSDRPWPWSDDRFAAIHAAHVVEHLPDPGAFLRECRRVLSGGGELTLVVPIGLNAVADPDHEHEWTWKTPCYLTGARHWDEECRLTVVDRDVTLWSTLTGLPGRAHYWSLQARLALRGPGQWCFTEPHSGGEFTVRFQA